MLPGDDFGAPQPLQNGVSLTQGEYLEKIWKKYNKIMNRGRPEKTEYEKAKDDVWFLGRAWELAKSLENCNLGRDYGLEKRYAVALCNAMERERNLANEE